MRNNSIPHDIIEFFEIRYPRIFEIVAPLYQKGLSITEIANQTGLKRSAILAPCFVVGLLIEGSFAEDQEPEGAKKGSKDSSLDNHLAIAGKAMTIAQRWRGLVS